MDLAVVSTQYLYLTKKKKRQDVSSGPVGSFFYVVGIPLFHPSFECF